MIKSRKELIFPILGIVEILFLLKYEALNPSMFYQYTDRLYRANDLSVNFLLILSFMVYLLYSINKYTIKRDEILYTFSITDQLTGLYIEDICLILWKNSMNQIKASISQ